MSTSFGWVSCAVRSSTARTGNDVLATLGALLALSAMDRAAKRTPRKEVKPEKPIAPLQCVLYAALSCSSR